MKLIVTTVKGITFEMPIITREVTIASDGYASKDKKATQYKTDSNSCKAFNNWFWSVDVVKDAVLSDAFYKSVIIAK